jgi:hypothetical protein
MVFWGLRICPEKGMMEYWNIGHEKWKTEYPTSNVEAIFFDDARQASIFCFFSLKYSIKQKNP